MRKNDYSVEAKFFRGLSDSTRLSVLLTLIDGEKTVGEIVETTQQSQSNVSNHLKCLSGCGLVKNRRNGKNIYYSFRDLQTKKLLKLSEQVISKVYSDIAACLRYQK
ncbi:MAG: metalloregulator ArsR/SmtB family transcription factor [Patescibacteria group bacterium]|nr:metalloregulator ArsR/SmtB family transcription factor [Patescibacteria group bacterium]